MQVLPYPGYGRCNRLCSRILLLIHRFALSMFLSLHAYRSTGLIADVTLYALTRLRSYLRSAGRYGSSPFLVGHYGGLGEIAQGFCRVSAVSGGVYILDRKSEATSVSGDKFVIQLQDFPDPLTADVLITAQDQFPMSLRPSPEHDMPLSSIARCIAVIDKPIPFPPLLSSEEGQSEGDAESIPATSGGEGADRQKPESTTSPEIPPEAAPIDTSVIIFPPNSVNGGSSTKAAQAFATGAGTLSAPQGKCKYPLSRIECVLTHA
jgi:Rab proteins geranylgeranyltransferase component A